MKRIFENIFVTAAALTMLTACSDWENGWAEKSVHTEPVKLASYLYEMTYTDYNSDGAVAVIDGTGRYASGAACSVVRNGNFVGRNLDFYYDDMAEIIVHVSANKDRFASIGISSCNPNMTPKLIDKGRKTLFYDVVPYFVTDGINEKGVYASINMAPTGDLAPTTGTNPGAGTLCGTMVVRYVLDNCSTAREACERLSKINIKASSTLGEFHYVIADANDTYMVETIDNKLVYSKDAGNIQTNYFMLHDGMTPKGSGMEREALLKQHYAEGSTFEGMCSLLESVKYSKMYDRNMNPFWYSEFNGDVWKGKTITNDTPHEFYEEMIDKQINNYNNRKRSYLEDVWITVHTSVYDLEEKTLRVYSQEDYSKYWEYQIATVR